MTALAKLWQAQKSMLIPAIQQHSNVVMRRVYGHHLLYMGPTSGFGAIHAAVGHRHRFGLDSHADVLGDGALPYRTGSIDCLVSLFDLTVSHMQLSEFERILAPGGTLIIINPHPVSSALWHQFSLCCELPWPMFIQRQLSRLKLVQYERFHCGNGQFLAKCAQYIGPTFIMAFRKTHSPFTPVAYPVGVGLEAQHQERHETR